MSVPEVPEGAPAELTVGGRGAAFFDLDKTLMQGSSAFQFARAVRAGGLISRRQLAGDASAGPVLHQAAVAARDLTPYQNQSQR